MNWIILALTLGASITSIIHGVFMLFGSLSITGGPLVGMPSTLLASLPIAAAVFALIGGIIAFNQSKWGALFLLLAAGICTAARDTWLYAGIYVFAGLFCFFLKKRQDDYRDIYDDDYDEEDSNPDGRGYTEGEEFFYDDDSSDDFRPSTPLNNSVNLDTLDDGERLDNFQPASQPPAQPPKLRIRSSKTCPTCGMTVARDAKFCSSCGTKLFVMNDLSANSNNQVPDIINKPQNDFTAVPEPQHEPENVSNTVNINMNDGDEMSSAGALPNYRVLVNPGRNNRYNSRHDPEEAASSYQEFSSSKYTKRGKNRRRSPFKRIFGILLLVGAVGGALYFLLSLRKLPPGDLPPMVRPEVIPQPQRRQHNPSASEDISIAQPVENVVVTENILPNFTPDRTPKSGVITGNGVNIRADHSTSSARVTRLSNGSRVEVFDSWTGRSGNLNGTWYHIRTNNREGWVYGQYMQPIGGGLPQGYSNALIKSFGSNKNQLIESLGQPTRSSNTSAEWPGLTVSFRGDDITRVRITQAKHELQNGLKVGMSQTALLQIMGYPSSMSNRVMNYNEGSTTGLSVQLDRNNSITSITVNEVR
ncbi:MAG: SH3 domain-containing protein [Synergistaceae bacterium]|nr:SH3 domain-containing protein [Synergistaceae bacterium]